jgi:hypothetical protein
MTGITPKKKDDVDLKTEQFGNSGGFGHGGGALPERPTAGASIW